MSGCEEVDAEIERWFTDPSIHPSTYAERLGDRRPLLFLLRRDLKDQYGDENEPPIRPIISPLLICLGILVGFELLAKLWSGKHQFNRGERTVHSFYQEIVGFGAEEAEALVEFRNLLAHTYGLRGREYSFTVRGDVAGAEDDIKITSDESGKSRVYINVWRLKKLFVQAVREYKRLLEMDKERQCKFMGCLPHLGEIAIEEVNNKPK